MAHGPQNNELQSQKVKVIIPGLSIRNNFLKSKTMAGDKQCR
jgi:hypothetical protein